MSFVAVAVTLPAAPGVVVAHGVPAATKRVVVQSPVWRIAIVWIAGRRPFHLLQAPRIDLGRILLALLARLREPLLPEPAQSLLVLEIDRRLLVVVVRHGISIEGGAVCHGGVTIRLRRQPGFSSPGKCLRRHLNLSRQLGRAAAKGRAVAA